MPTRAELEALAAKGLIDPATVDLMPPDAPMGGASMPPPPEPVASGGLPPPPAAPLPDMLKKPAPDGPVDPGLASAFAAQGLSLTPPPAKPPERDPFDYSVPPGARLAPPGGGSAATASGDIVGRLMKDDGRTRADVEAQRADWMKQTGRSAAAWEAEAAAEHDAVKAAQAAGGGPNRQPEVTVEGRAPTPNLMAGLRGGVVYDPKTGEVVHEKPAVDRRDPRVIAQEAAFAERDKMKGAATDKTTAEVERADEQYRIRRAEDLRMQDQEAQDKEARAKDDAAIHQRVQDVDAAVADYANTKVDPQAYYTNQSVAQRAFGILAAAVGGMAGAMNGTNRNDVLAALQRGQDLDIKAQEAALNQKGKTVDAKRSALHDMMQITGNQDAARAGLRASMWEAAKRKLITDASKYEGRIDQAELKNYVAGIDEKIAQERGALQTQLRNEAAAKAAAARAQAAAQEQKNFDRGLKLDESAREWKKLDVDAKKAAAAPGQENSPANQERGYQAASNDVFSAFEDASKNKPAWLLSWAPSLTQSSKQYDADLVRIMQSARMPGDSDTRTQEMLLRLAPQPGDGEETLARKKQLLKTTLMAKYPNAPSVQGALPKPTTVATKAAPGST